MSKTRLIEAVKTLDLAETKKILDAKPELLRVWDDRGRNLLHLACSVEPEDVGKSEGAGVKMAAFLLEHGLDIEEEGGAGRDRCKPIWFATAKGRNAALVRFLLQKGAKPTGLYAAGWWQDLKILNMLIDAGANMEEVAGVTPFLACWGWQRFDAAKALALKGADVNVQDARGRTALYIGVEKEYGPALLEWLVKHGASPDIANREGISAREKASRKRDKRFLAALQTPHR
jgi:ankyrin repeat protein